MSTFAQVFEVRFVQGVVFVRVDICVIFCFWFCFCEGEGERLGYVRVVGVLWVCAVLGVVYLVIFWRM